MESKALTLSMHCTCGASVLAKVNQVQLADGLLRLFANQHSGPGHAPCYPKRRKRHRQGFDTRPKAEIA